jgi:hypothetical protein
MFFMLSMTAQAQLIGCHRKTWKNTKFYQKARKKREDLRKKPERKPRGPKTIALSDGLRNVLVSAEDQPGDSQQNRSDLPDVPRATVDQPEDRPQDQSDSQDRKETLDDVIAQHNADAEPSPLDPRPRNVHRRRRRQ